MLFQLRARERVPVQPLQGKPLLQNALGSMMFGQLTGWSQLAIVQGNPSFYVLYPCMCMCIE